jgi:hypothetical protein
MTRTFNLIGFALIGAGISCGVYLVLTATPGWRMYGLLLSHMNCWALGRLMSSRR